MSDAEDAPVEKMRRIEKSHAANVSQLDQGWMEWEENAEDLRGVYEATEGATRASTQYLRAAVKFMLLNLAVRRQHRVIDEIQQRD